MWRPGRQGTGYRILSLLSSKLLRCDCYLIDCPVGTDIPFHVDLVPGRRHYRFNVLLWGENTFRGQVLYSTRRVKFFRSDLPHSLGTINKRSMMLSFGWAR